MLLPAESCVSERSRQNCGRVGYAPFIALARCRICSRKDEIILLSSEPFLSVVIPLTFTVYHLPLLFTTVSSIFRTRICTTLQRLSLSAHETIPAIQARFVHVASDCPSLLLPFRSFSMFILRCHDPERFTHIGHSRDPPDDIRQRGVAMFPVSTSVISIVTRTSTSWCEGSGVWRNSAERLVKHCRCPTIDVIPERPREYR